MFLRSLSRKKLLTYLLIAVFVVGGVGIICQKASADLATSAYLPTEQMASNSITDSITSALGSLFDVENAWNYYKTPDFQTQLNNVEQASKNLALLKAILATVDSKLAASPDDKDLQAKRVEIVNSISKVSKDQQKTNNRVNEIASPKSSSLSDILFQAFAWLLYALFYGLGLVFMLVIKAMLIVGTYNDFVNQPAVSVGWTITRDICNNFFIVILIAIAIGTSLNLGSYQWRSTLPKVLVFAVLINFSKMFVGIMIDVSQVIMLTFAAPLSTTHGYNIVLASFNIPSYANFGDSIKAANVQWLDVIAALIFAIAILITAIVVVSCIAVILVYRIVILMFLVILSPLWLFAKGAGPLAKPIGSISGTWEGDLAKMLTVGPAMMFFLYISMMTLGYSIDTTSTTSTATTSTTAGAAANAPTVKPILQMKNDDNTNADNYALAGTGSGATNFSNMASVDGVINFLIIVGLLWASLMMGQKFGDKAGSVAGSGMNWLSKQGKRFSGFNLAKGATKVPGMIATGVDDKIGLRAGLYRGLYKVGGKYVPGLNTAIGSKIGTLESGTSKRRQQQVDAANSALGMSRMNEEELRKSANSIAASTEQRMAATMQLMKNGMLKDDDTAHQNENVRLINFYRKTLPPDMVNTFDQSVQKAAPNLAIMSDIYSKGKNIAKMEADIKAGKLDFGEVLKNANKGTLDAIALALSNNDKYNKNGAENQLMMFLRENSKGDKDFGAKVADMSKDAKDALNKTTYASFKGKDADEQKKFNKMRDAYIKGAKDLGRNDELFDETNADEMKARRNFMEINKSWVGQEATAKQIENIIKQDADLLDAKTIEAMKDRTTEISDMVEKTFENLANSLAASQLSTTSTDPAQVAAVAAAKKKLENALIAGAEIDLADSGRNVAASEIMKGKSKSKVMENMNRNNVNEHLMLAMVNADAKDADYENFDKTKVKEGFKKLTGSSSTQALATSTDITDQKRAAQIYEQALINGAEVEANTTGRRKAYKAALNGKRKSDIINNISAETVNSDEFIKAASDLKAEDIAAIASQSDAHRKNLQDQLTARMRFVTKNDLTKTISQAIASGARIDTSDAKIYTGFENAAGRMNINHLNNGNFKDSTGSWDYGQIRIVAEKMNIGALKAFIEKAETPGQLELAQQIVSIIRTEWDPATRASTASKAQQDRYEALKKEGII